MCFNNSRRNNTSAGVCIRPRGRKLRVDTTVVETNIHYPTDSSLLVDGTRVLTRTMKKIECKSGGLNAR